MGFGPILAAATAVSAVSQIAGGASANAAAKANARIKENQAGFEVAAAGVEAQRSAQRFRRFAGGQRGDVAAMGGQIGSGTGLLLAERAAREAMLDQANLAASGENRARGLRMDADMTRIEGRAARRDGFMGGLATAIGGFGRYSQTTGSTFGLGG